MALRPRRTHQQQPQAASVRKASSTYVGLSSTASLSAGSREFTDTGFLVLGTSNKAFETYYELMMPNTAGPLLVHPTKVRVYRVIDGMGYVFMTDTTSQKEVQKALHPGDEIVVEPSTAYKLSTTAKTPLHLAVVQEAKYTAKLQELAPADATVSMAESAQVGDFAAEQEQPTYERYPSKAREQAMALKGQTAVREVPRMENNGINAMPIHNFSDEDAG